MRKITVFLFIVVCLYYIFESQWRSSSIFVNLQADSTVSGLRLSYGQDGKKNFSVRAEKGSFFYARDMIFLQKPTFIFEDKEIPIEVSSPQGEIRRKKGEVRLINPVEGRWGETVIRSSELIYRSLKELLFLQGGVVVSNPVFLLKTSEIRFDFKNGKMLAGKGVQVTFLSEKNSATEKRK